MTKEILTLDDLKATNLPELKGFKETQEALVKQYPFIEITDNASYEIAKKNRTTLLKGRTSLESQDKLIASKLSNFRKDVKTIIDGLVAITLPHEEKQQAEVKRFEEIKEKERLEKERIENSRIKTIKDKIESIETECYEVVQKMTFQSIIIDCDTVAKIYGVEFDFEEYDILFEQVEDRVQNALNNKISDLTEKEKNRVEKENLQKEVFSVREKRLLEIGFELNDENVFVHKDLFAGIAKESVFECDSNEFETILSDAKDSIEKAKQKEREAKENEEKEKVFEIRKNRLTEIGLVLNVFNVFTHPIYSLKNLYNYEKENIFNCDVIDFENLLTDAKNLIIEAQEKADKAQKDKEAADKLEKENKAKAEKENKARIKRLSQDKAIYKKTLSETLGRFPIVFDADQIEVKNFSIKASNRVTDLYNQLLTELENL